MNLSAEGKILNGEVPLIEGEDFYWDPSGFMVFTAKYLLKRGYCCHQGCRHCPYDSVPPLADGTGNTSDSE